MLWRWSTIQHNWYKSTTEIYHLIQFNTISVWKNVSSIGRRCLHMFYRQPSFTSCVLLNIQQFHMQLWWEFYIHGHECFCGNKCHGNIRLVMSQTILKFVFFSIDDACMLYNGLFLNQCRYMSTVLDRFPILVLALMHPLTSTIPYNTQLGF